MKKKIKRIAIKILIILCIISMNISFIHYENPKMKAINWAILAPGKIAHKMAKAMLKSKGKAKLNLYAIGSRNAERAKKFAEIYGFERSYGSYKELLEDPNVDAVYIANPHAFHFDLIMQSLEAGKHVLCEKPAVCNMTQLKKVIEKSKEKKLFFMEAMWTAFNPCIKRVKKVISEGKIGKIKHIQSFFNTRTPFNPKHRLWAPELAGGALLDLGIYNIFYAMTINNYEPIISHSSNVRLVNGIDAWNSVNLTFQNGVTTHFESSCDMPNPSKTHNSVIYGTKGYIISKNFFMQTKAEVHVYKGEGNNEKDLVEVIEEPFDVNGFEYELIEANECILDGKIESDIHGFQRSIDLRSIMDQLRNDWGLKYPFEK
jgi:predicted dehydrogenase